MPNRTSTDDRRGPIGAAAVAVLLMLASVTAIAMGVRGAAGPPQPAAAAPVASPAPTPGRALASPRKPTPGATTRPTPQSSGLEALRPLPRTEPKIGPFLPASRPTVLDIPSIGVHAPDFVDLRIAVDGSLTVPGNTTAVGFFRDGPSPGQLGTAVLGAHVDSKEGPGVFYRLGAVRVGARVQITRADRSVAAFVVDKVQAFPKDRFPDEVYRGDFTRSEIRLITCGGSFDRSTGHYRDNVVVFAHLVAS